MATFDWLPVTKDLLQFWPTDDAYANRRVVVEEEQTQPVTTRLVRTEAIRGRVVHADGTPAAGIWLEAYGSGKKLDNGRGEALTGADGRYEMMVSPDEAYAVYVEDRDRAARSRLDVVVRRGKPAEGVDFTLTRGTLLRGTVSVGDGNKPASGVYIRLDENGGPAPEEFRDADDKFTAHEVRRQFGVSTDAAGHYSIRIGPGTYTLMGPPRTKDEKLVVKDETELVRDFRMPRPERGPFAGRVVRADDLSKGVAGARVEVVAASLSRSYHPLVTADSEGRFRLERSLDPITICALSPDGSLGAIVERGADDPGAIIAVSPTATATGLLLDEKGKPAAKQPLSWGRRVYLDPEKSIMSDHFAPKVVTDESGRFTLPSLVVGQDYHIAVMRENQFAMAGMARPRKPGPMDLGTLQVGAFKPSPEEVAEAESSFEKDAARCRRGCAGHRGDDPRRRAAHARAVQGQVRPARLLGHLVRPVHQGDPHAPGRARGVRRRRAFRDGEPERGREDRRAEEVPVEAPAPLDPGFPRRRHPRADARQVRHPGDPRLRPGRPRRQDRRAGHARRGDQEGGRRSDGEVAGGSGLGIANDPVGELPPRIVWPGAGPMRRAGEPDPWLPQRPRRIRRQYRLLRGPVYTDTSDPGSRTAVHDQFLLNCKSSDEIQLDLFRRDTRRGRGTSGSTIRPF